MKTKLFFLLTFTLIGSQIWAATGQAGQKNKGPSPEMQAKMEQAKKAGMPGPDHEVLNAFVGNWNVTGRFWMQPGAKVQRSSATSTIKWILGDRFLKQKYQGDWQGQSFEGMGFIGYDKVKKEYVSTWMDNVSTGIMQSSGQYDPTAKTIKESGTFSCPMTGERDKPYRAIWQIRGKNRFTFTMFSTNPQGKEYKSMVLDYRRAK